MFSRIGYNSASLRIAYFSTQFMKQCQPNIVQNRVSKQMLSKLRYSTDSDKNETSESFDSQPTTERKMKRFFNAEPISGFGTTDVPASESWSDVTSINYEKFSSSSSSRIIYDISEEELGLVEEPQPKAPPIIENADIISFARGKHGVYDVEELVHLLNYNNAKDLVVMKIPDTIRFVEHIILVTGISQKHINAMALRVNQGFNKKMSLKKDRGLILEGKYSTWVAMDLGNIALHIMSPGERRRIDMESLWLCGPEHDLELQKAVEESNEDDIFSLANEEQELEDFQEATYDITKEYIHPYQPVSETEVLPDYDDITDENRNTFTATSLMEMALRKHNEELSKKYRGRFRK